MNRRALFRVLMFLSACKLGKLLLIIREPHLLTVFGTEATLSLSRKSWELHRKDGTVYFCKAKLPTSIASIPEE